MNNDIKSGVGYFIPLAAVIGFFTALFLGEYLLSVFVAIAGILVWFLYMVVMESSPPSNLGNLIIFFGILLSVGVFMGFGVTQNMWGGIEFVSEGSLFALVVFFFSILTGLLFRNQPVFQTAGSNNNLTDQEKQWIQNALNENNMQSKNLAINKGGYLNAALRWTFVDHLHIEMDFNNLLFDNDKVDYFNRELKITYIEYF